MTLRAMQPWCRVICIGSAMIDVIEACETFSQELEQEGWVASGWASAATPHRWWGETWVHRTAWGYTVTSSSVDATQRIEDLCEEFGLLFSGATYDQAENVIQVGEPMRTRLRGQNRDRLAYPLSASEKPLPQSGRGLSSAALSGLVKSSPRDETIPEMRLSL